MLKKEINLLLIFSLLIFNTSCVNEDRIRLYVYKSKPILYNDISKTLDKWIEDSISVSKSLFFRKNDYKLDSLIVLNKDTTLLYTTINIKGTYKDSKLDYIEDLGGSLINDEWYFFMNGGTTAIDRTLYKNSKYTPYTFEELSYISHKTIYPKAVRWQPDGSYTVKEEFFQKQYFDPIRKKCSEGQDIRMCFDSIIIQLNKQYYDYKIDPKEIEDIKRSMETSVRPDELGKEPTTQEKLFETEEWKDYINKKTKSDE